MLAKTASPLVYIVILCWNSSQDVVECLESLKHLDYPYYQIVVVDNGSTDNTVAMVREHFAKIPVIENRINLGFTEGNNAGVRYALDKGADYIFLLNDDTTVEPDVISRLVQVGEQDSNIGMLGATVVSYNDHSREYMGATIDWRTGMTAYGTAILSQPADVDYVAGCALMVKSLVVRKIGLLESKLFTYFEDADWGMRCRQFGYRIVAVPQARIYHKGTPDNTTHTSPTLLFYYRRNQYFFMKRFSKPSQWWGFLRRYVQQSWTQFYHYQSRGEYILANAVMGGFWAGITGRYGAERIQAPNWLKQLVFSFIKTVRWVSH